MRPNPPRMGTVVIAVALFFVGIALVFFHASAIDLVLDLPLGRDWTRQIVSFMGEQMVPWAALAAAPIVLIVGSVLPRI